jgi:hypothetical protein
MDGFFIYAVDMASGSMIYIESFMIIGSSIGVILPVLSQQFEGL